MKKALVLVLSVLMVLSMVTAALAVDITYEGNVKVKWGNNTALQDKNTGFSTDTLEYKLKFNILKEYSDEVSAGFTVEHKADNDDHGKVVDNKNIYLLNTNAWIKLNYDLFDVTAFTFDKGAVGKDFGQFDLSRGSGVKADLALFDGLALTGLVNQGFGDYRFLVKGEYAADLFTLGGGFQSQNGTGVEAKKTALGVYGTFNLMDNLTLKGEYGSRKLGANKDEKATTAILAGAKYDDGVLMIDGNYLTAGKGFDIIDYWADGDDWKARDQVKNVSDAADGQTSKFAVGEASVVYVDASYALTDALKVVGNFDYILNAKDVNDQVIKFDQDANKGYNMSYKAGVTYQFTDALKGEGWFRAYGQYRNQFGGKATYTFAKGVEGIFELTNSGTGVKDAKRVTAYKAVLAAKF